MTPISYKPETGDTERLLCPGGPHRVLVFRLIPERSTVRKMCSSLPLKDAGGP